MPYEHPDCYFRMNKVGGTFTFYVSTDGEMWVQVTHSIMPNGDFDITIPVAIPETTAKPFILPEEGDEDDIV